MEAIAQKDLAAFLLEAEENVHDVKRITESKVPELTVEQAYKIQRDLVDLKLEKGLTIVGPKMGLTSKAKMDQMNVKDPIYGYIFSNMIHEGGSNISRKELIHPKVEAEIAFVLAEDIEGPGITAAQVLRATAYIVPAIEIIDSRYENFKFTLPDVIADNASSSKVVLGDKIKLPNDLDLALVGTTLEINGELKAAGAGAAVLGHPAHAVAMLVNMLAKSGGKLHKGEVILSGAITEAILVESGDTVYAKWDGIGEISFSFVD